MLLKTPSPCLNGAVVHQLLHVSDNEEKLLLLSILEESAIRSQVRALASHSAKCNRSGFLLYSYLLNSTIVQYGAGPDTRAIDAHLGGKIYRSPSTSSRRQILGQSQKRGGRSGGSTRASAEGYI